MKRAIIISAAIILIVLIGLVAVINYASLSKNSDSKPFYVGVTFGGSTSSDAKLLIDKVKNYTNLFVLQSGVLQRNNTVMDEIGDYAIASGLHFAVYSGVDEAFQSTDWINTAQQRWGTQFLGIYYNDEPGGKMLDGYVNLVPSISNTTVGNSITTIGSAGVLKLGGGGIQVGDTTYYPNGTIRVYKSTGMPPNPSSWTSSSDTPKVVDGTNTDISYYPNGSITINESANSITYYPDGSLTEQLKGKDFFTMENGSDRISQVEPYSSVLAKSPIKNCDEAAQNFVNRNRSSLSWLDNQSVTLFTADYALYWWDYQSGYDVVLAELGWNNTVAQEIGLVRGAANLQDKSWGTILTWKYTHAPYLTDGQEMFGQMKASYEAGAEYVVVFNYAEDMSGPYGTLQEEHFQALERFWNQVVQNPNVVHGGVKAEAALVLPKNYGWGMRNPTDKIWGIWNTNSTSQQIWIQLQSKLAQYGSKLDIVYDDPAYAVVGKYSQIFYWNQTS